MAESTSIPFAVGTWLENRYRILGLLGQGGMSRVYLAEDSRLGVRVAVKEDVQASAEAKKQFELEARLLASLSHPNLPRVTDHFVEPGGRRCMVMDYIEGEDLAAMVQRVGALPEATALNWIRQILGAVEYLHSQSPPIIHRDIKPANIKITPQGKAVLVDFGIAKLYDPQRGTATGLPAVTPGYAPPEQYGLRTTQRSDIYALGATLYTLVTGQTPPEAPLRQAGEEGLVPPGRLAAVSPSTEQAIVRAMELENTRRWQSAGELRAALEGRSSGVSSLQPTVFAATSPKRRNILAPLAAAVIGIGIIVIAIMVAQSVQSITLTVALSSPTPVSSLTPEPTAPPGLAELAVVPPPGVTPSATGPTEKVSVPLVVGASLDSALAILQRANLEVEKAEEANTSCGVGVMRQEPEMGTMVDAGSRIRIVVCVEATPTRASSKGSGPVSTAMPIPTPFVNDGTVPVDQLIFSDDFSTQNRGWSFATTATTRYFYEAGEYHIGMKQDNLMSYQVVLDRSAKDYAVQVDVRRVEGVDDCYGLMFRYQMDAKEKGSAYTLEVCPGLSTYRARKRLAGEWKLYLIATTSSPSIKRGDETNRLLVVAKGASFTYYINGTRMGTATDASIPNGQVGIFGSASKAPTDHAFDNLFIWSLP